MTTDAERRAKAKYRREKTHQIQISFYPADEELYDWIKAQPNMSAYIKDLVRADMARTN